MELARFTELKAETTDGTKVHEREVSREFWFGERM